MSSAGFKLSSQVEIKSLEGLRTYLSQQLDGWGARAVVLLSGPMGSGKTEFVKAWSEVSGAKQQINSPTYAIHHQYSGADHFDLYRIRDSSELETTGIFDLFSEKVGLIFIEWPEKMNTSEIPKSWSCFFYKLEVIEGQRRRILKYLRE